MDKKRYPGTSLQVLGFFVFGAEKVTTTTTTFLGKIVVALGYKG
ncbi:hypothetical protein [uncultured Desulfuromusa sp.]